MPDPMPLAAAFPQAGEDAWRALAEKALAGKPLSALTATTDDGIAVPPLSPAAGAAAAPSRPVAAPWGVVQRIELPDPAAAATQALADLEGGASGLALVFAASPGARGYGLAADARALATVLDGVDIGAVTLRLEAGPETAAALDAFLAVAARHRAVPLRLATAWSPFGTTLGGSPPEAAAVAAAARGFVDRLDGAGIAGPLFLADGRPLHDIGASEAQELAAVLAMAVAALRLLADEAAPAGRIGFALAADVDEFATLAKMRALRAVWARVLEDCGHPPAAAEIHAETSWRMLARRDPWTNALRSTIAAFAAGVGGADSVTVLPHTAALGLPDAAARRLARNTQAILIEEAQLWRVADPAAGSGAIEGLTAALAACAWEHFRDIERAGGIAAALAGGRFHDAVAATRAARLAAVAGTSRRIVGTSVYAAEDDPAGGPGDPEALLAAARASLAAFRPAALFEGGMEAAE